ncbi:PQQ-binding-like beta-propeller repeat protein [Actinomadura nitritigenes]|uniref:outer membrane protein assembly factor BamB family protein n=1 Tax=Actinomadura nitritigenes TaxID=134602 RepID=UPI0036BEE346
MDSRLKSLGAHDPARVGPYRLLAVLGSGGMGRVYLGRSPGARAAAVKVVRPELSGDPAFLARFQREVAAARAVGGAFTSPVLDADPSADPPWLATAFVAGPPLSDAVRAHGPLEEPVVRVLGAALAEALAAVHAAGLVHRDLKPANVLLAADGPRVIDFGISRALDGTAVTHSGALVGSPAFMAPEQVASGRRAGPAADVFALGGVLVHAATGTPPFGTGAVPAVLARVVGADPRLDGVPDGLRPVVAACLDKDPGRRPSPEELVERLGGADPGEWWPAPVRAEIAARAGEASALLAAPPLAPPVPDGSPTHPGAAEDDAPTVREPSPTRILTGPPGRRRFLVVAGAAAGATAAAGVTGWLLHDRDSDRPHGPRSATVGAPQGPRPLWTYTPALDDLVPNPPTVVRGGTVLLGETSGLTCLDAATGARRWAVRVDAGFDHVEVSGDTVYGRARDGELFAFDAATGERRWRVAGDRLPLRPDDDVAGVAGTLMIGRRYPTGEGPASVRAFEVPGGRTRWRLEVASRLMPVLVAGRLLAAGKGAVLAVDAATGRRMWLTPLAEDPPSLQVSESAVLVPGAGTLTAFASGTGARLWTAGGLGRLLPTVLAAAGNLVCVADGPTAIGLDARTGSVRWRTRLPAAPAAATPPWSPALVAVPLAPDDAQARAGAGAGLAALDPGGGRVRWTYRVPNDAETKWDVRTDGARVYAFDSRRLLVFRG